jgi:hypothetical protein
MTPQEARALADRIRPFAPTKAAEIDEAASELEDGRRESLSVDVGIHYRLEKFDGDYKPGMSPVEVVEGDG